MATYIIGDVQGCHTELQHLLIEVDFDPERDKLGFVGDLVNRGPDSLDVLRFVKNLPDPWVVLGNHDLHLLALGYGVELYQKDHALDDVLAAPDKLELLEWLRAQPLLHYEPSIDTVLVHAGIPPQWTLQEAMSHAQAASDQLRGPDFLDCLRHLYGDSPNQWTDHLSGWDRTRYIINALTRLRFCTRDGELDLTNKTRHSTDPQHWRPWFDWYQQPHQILFGHWAALEGQCDQPRCEALDTGCAWGRSLTAYRLEDRRRFSVPAA